MWSVTAWVLRLVGGSGGGAIEWLEAHERARPASRSTSARKSFPAPSRGVDPGDLQNGACRRGVFEQLDEHVHQEIAIADRRPHRSGAPPDISMPNA